jgi:hypothetical protein
LWIKLHNEELKEPYSLPNIIWFVMSRSWGGGVASIGKRCINVWWKNLRERVYLEDAGIDGKMTLN